MSYLSKTKKKHAYRPLTLFNVSFFMAFNITLLVASTALEDFPADFPISSSALRVLLIVLFVVTRIYIFGNFRIKTGALTAIASVLALDAITLIMISAVLALDLYVSQLACLPFLMLTLFRGHNWRFLFSRKKM